MSLAENRQRLRPWLEGKINSGSVPGLEWVNAELTMFKLPWKHAGKQNWCETDCLLFKEWAIHTGKYREGHDTPDWATWKTRLRCAFNKAWDIQEVKNLSRVDDQDSPYRVYKLLPKPDKPLKCQQDVYNHQSPTYDIEYKAEPMEAYNPSSQAAVPAQLPTTIPQNFPTDHIYSSVNATSGSIPSDLKGIDDRDLLHQQPINEPANLMMSNQPWGDQSWPNRDMSVGSVSPTGDESYQYNMMDMDNGAIIDTNMAEDNVLLINGLMSCTGSSDMIFDDSFLNQLNRQIEFTRNHRLAVKICYKEDIMYDYLVESEAGCRIFYGLPLGQKVSHGVDPTKLFGPSHLQQIEFPNCVGLCGQSPDIQRKTEMILGYIDRGLILEIDQAGNIYATRLCRCVVFVAIPFSNKNPEKLERQKRMKVFDFENEFVPAYNNYAANKGPKPSIQVHFGFGQTWSCTQLFSNLMVKAVVINTRAFELMSQIQNSTTTMSAASLCVSKDDEYDQLADRMKRQTLHEFAPIEPLGVEGY